MHITSVLLLIIFITIGCATEPQNPTTQHNHSVTPSGDIQETTTGQNLPGFLKGSDHQISEIYQLVAAHPDVVKQIPCYCGCGSSVGHRSSFNCFIAEMKKDAITWDSHGMKCGVCLDIAAESISLKQQGKSIKDIRQFIDQKYKDGYAPPTPTPMPS